MRPSRLLAIARLDWANELKGRQGLLLPGVIAGLLLPASLVPSPVQVISSTYVDQLVRVEGEVPAEVRALPVVDPDSTLRVAFSRAPDGTLLVDADAMPRALREALDGGAPAVEVEITPRGFRFPGRSMLLALVSASTLTGAVASSIGGERSRRTLVILLSAAVTRAEIVLGKWLAWAGLGAGAGLAAAAAAIATGRVEPGWWLLPLPTVPMATVALGLWLVRQATDVVAGTATSLRVLPVTIALTAIVAWLLGDQAPWLGALVPLGGALIASGDTWDGPGPPLLAAATTLAVTVGWLAATIRDLEEQTDRDPPEPKTLFALAFGALAAACWWLPVAMPLLWAEAGNPKLIEALPVSSGAVAGAACLTTATVVRAARSTRRVEVELGLGRVPTVAWAAAVAAGLALALTGSASTLWPPPEDELLAAIRERMAAVLQPAPFGVAFMAIVAEELVFRGWLARAVGPLRASLAWAAVKAPLDPIGGLVAAGALGAVGALGGPVAAIAARAVWWAALLTLPTLPPGVALALGVALVATLGLLAWRRG